MKRRVFLLGLDGASWNVLDRMFEAGVMPQLQQLCRDGVHAVLESTVPPVTPVAWTSLMTGVNPGKHGVFAFNRKSKESSYLTEPVNRMHMRVPTLFDYYREGGPLISLNLPMSYPATEINGLMVTGMMTPLRNMGRFEHPAGLLERFSAAGIDYTIDPKFKVDKNVQAPQMLADWQSSGATFVEQLKDITRNRMRAVHLLLDEEKWDVFICVIVGTDRIQHLHWDKLITADGSGPDPVMASYYAEVDAEIGRLRQRLGPEDTLFIVSDHGFTEHRGAFLANEWLRREGWLTPRQARRNPLYPLRKLLQRFGINRDSLAGILGEKSAAQLQLAASHIDWQRTQAYHSSPFGIRVNLEGREVMGCVKRDRFQSVRDAIISRLGELNDAEGQPLLASIVTAEECYWGDATEEAADIVFTFRDDRSYTSYTGALGPEIFQATPHRPGDHRIDGIFVGHGGGIRNVPEQLRFRIWDVLPTLMHLNGRKVPGICDGRVLAEIIAEQRDIEIDENWQRFAGDRPEIPYDRAQEDEIQERLKALGYLSDD